MTDRRAKAVEALSKHMPILARSASSEQAVLAMRAGDGREVTPEVRDELLGKLAAHEYVELEVELLAYEQQAGRPNRKFLRFRDGLMLSLGRSAASKPFLRDHDQGDVMARGGTITASRTEKRAEGDYAIHQTAKLTAPWAVEQALRGLLDRVSIGWHPNALPHCTACKAEVFSKCYHFPGDRLADEPGEDGRRRLVRRADGDKVVEWEFPDAEITETSFVNVPAVPAAGVRSIRASLSAELGLREDDDTPADTPVTDEPASAAHSLADEPVAPEPKEPTMSTSSAPKQPTEPTTPEAPTAAQPTADPEAVRLRVEQVLELQGIATKLGVDPEEAKRIALSTADREKAGFAILQLAAKAKPPEPVRHQHTELAVDEHDKRREAMGDVLKHRLLSSVGIPGMLRSAKAQNPNLEIPPELALPQLSDEVSQRYRRKRLLDLAEECLAARGINTKRLSDQEIAELALSPKLSSTSDFPLLLADSANKILLATYTIRQSPWRSFSRERNRPDFKQFKLIRRSSAPKLREIIEDGEVKYGGFSEKQETAEVKSYGVAVRFSRKMLINDDLDAFATATLGLGDSVIDNRDDIVVAVLTGSAAMSDGNPLFHADHNNIVGTTGEPGVTTIEAAEDLLAAQVETLRTGEERQLNFQLNGWFAARKQAVALDKYVNPRHNPVEAANGVGGMSLGHPIWWDNRLATTPRYYYGMDVTRTGLIVGSLEGESNPRFSQAIDWDTEGVKLKVNDDFYAALESWEWIVRVSTT